MSEHVHQPTEPESAEPTDVPEDINTSESADPSGSTPSGVATTGPPAPETGDLVIDAALRDLAEAPEDDLDAQVERGEQVQRTLQGRLSDLGG